MLFSWILAFTFTIDIFPDEGQEGSCSYAYKI